MKISGTSIRNEVKILSVEAQALSTKFEQELTAEEGEIKAPLVTLDQLENIYKKLSMFEGLQKQFNSKATVKFENAYITLAKAISLLGTYTKITLMLKKAIGIEKKSVYGFSRRRTETAAVVKPTVSQEDLLKEYKKYERACSDLRSGIGRANNMLLDLTLTTSQEEPE